jgi:hypothetical protein
MFNRKFTLYDVVGKSKININELINLGYNDSIQNKVKNDLLYNIR